MFNWFKSKIELKDKGNIASSFHVAKGIKIGSEIMVPDNFECLIFYNEKYYFSLKNGKNKVDNNSFSPLIHKQNKKGKLKNIKCVVHYVSKLEHNLKFKAKKKIFSVNFKISDSKKFLSLLLLYNFKINNEYTNAVLLDVFKELLSFNNYNSTQITPESLQTFGIQIINFCEQTSKKSIFKNTNQSTIIEQNDNEISQNTSVDNKEIAENNINETSNLIPSQQNVQENELRLETSQFPTCPKCKSIAKFNTTYCLRCGYKLEQD